MKSAVVIFFDKDGAPVDYKLACHKQQEPQLQEMARCMTQALIEGPRVCACGGKCHENLRYSSKNGNHAG